VSFQFSDVKFSPDLYTKIIVVDSGFTELFKNQKVRRF